MQRPALCLALALVVAASRLPAQEHAGVYSQTDIVRGSQLYTLNCAGCHGLTGTNVGTVDLQRGRFRTVVSDEDLRRVITAGVPLGGAMPAFGFEDADLTAIIAFIRAGLETAAGNVAIRIGDPGKGRALVQGKGECLTCHRVNGEGARKAPDLSDVGSARTPVALHRSLVDPTSVLMPLNRPFRAITRAGNVIAGRRLNEDTYTLLYTDEQGRLLSIEKADLREYEVIKTAAMPSYKDTLTAAEVADVVGYLLTLKDPNIPAGPAGRGGRGGGVAPQTAAAPVTSRLTN